MVMSAEHRSVKICSHSLVMVTSPNEYKIPEWDEKNPTKKNKQTNNCKHTPACKIQVYMYLIRFRNLIFYSINKFYTVVLWYSVVRLSVRLSVWDL